jgi:hypothetical protein
MTKTQSETLAKIHEAIRSVNMDRDATKLDVACAIMTAHAADPDRAFFSIDSGPSELGLEEKYDLVTRAYALLQKDEWVERVEKSQWNATDGVISLLATGFQLSKKAAASLFPKG